LPLEFGGSCKRKDLWPSLSYQTKAAQRSFHVHYGTKHGTAQASVRTSASASGDLPAGTDLSAGGRAGAGGSVRLCPPHGDAVAAQPGTERVRLEQLVPALQSGTLRRGGGQRGPVRANVSPRRPG